MVKIDRNDFASANIIQSPGFNYLMASGSDYYRDSSMFREWTEGKEVKDLCRDYDLAISTVEKILRKGRRIYAACKEDPTNTLDPDFVKKFRMAIMYPLQDSLTGLKFLAENGIWNDEEFLSFIPGEILEMRFDADQKHLLDILCKAYKYILKADYPDKDATTFVFIKSPAEYDIHVGLSLKKSQILIGEYSRENSMTIGKFQLAPIKFVYLREKEV